MYVPGKSVNIWKRKKLLIFITKSTPVYQSLECFYIVSLIAILIVSGIRQKHLESFLRYKLRCSPDNSIRVLKLSNNS